MQQQVIDNFKKNGIKINDATTSLDLAEKLGSADVDTLKKIVTEFYDGDSVPDVEGDNYIQTLAYSHALITAFEFDDDKIEASDIEAAHQKALEAVERMVTYKGSANSESDESDTDEPETASTEASPEASTPKPKKRNKKSIVSDLIDANPDATAREIVEMATTQNPGDIEVSTARMYFYNIRKERGLAPNGKRGRPSNDTQDKVMDIVSANAGTPKDEVVELIMKELDLTKATSDQYYSKANTKLKQSRGNS